MLFNVSTLLGDEVGSTRSYLIENETANVPSDDYVTTVNGAVDLVRSTHGILVNARLSVLPRLECGRCLKSFEQELALDIQEEFLAPIDSDTDKDIDDFLDDEFHLNDNQHLDLSEAVRQYEQSELPLSPVCRTDCQGLCPTCGQNMNQRTCDCEQEDTDGRWSSLAILADRLRMEDYDGGTEAQNSCSETETQTQPPQSN